jgi:CDP-diacylglycerol pyrophosphatase
MHGFAPRDFESIPRYQCPITVNHSNGSRQHVQHGHVINWMEKVRDDLDTSEFRVQTYWPPMLSTKTDKQ